MFSFSLTEAQTSLLARGIQICSSSQTLSKGGLHNSFISPPRVAAELRADTSKPLDKTYPSKPNITIQKTKAIKELKSDQSRIILTADKEVAMVVMDRQDYNTKAQG